jgi:hypothetical protein
MSERNFDLERRQAHALLDALTAEKLNAVRSLLEVTVEPLGRSLALAPVEEEGLRPAAAELAPVLHSLVERASHTTKSCANSA